MVVKRIRGVRYKTWKLGFIWSSAHGGDYIVVLQQFCFSSSDLKLPRTVLSPFRWGYALCITSAFQPLLEGQTASVSSAQIPFPIQNQNISLMHLFQNTPQKPIPKRSFSLWALSTSLFLHPPPARFEFPVLKNKNRGKEGGTSLPAAPLTLPGILIDSFIGLYLWVRWWQTDCTLPHLIAGHTCTCTHTIYAVILFMGDKNSAETNSMRLLFLNGSSAWNDVIKDTFSSQFCNFFC